MEQIVFLNENSYEIPNEELLKDICLEIISDEKEHGIVNVIFCDDETIQELNKNFRKKDQTTDVLSFNWHDEDILGEIYISVPQVTRQAPDFSMTYDLELKKMLIHGMLHLCDYDHIEDEDYKVMQEREDYYFNKIDNS